MNHEMINCKVCGNLASYLCGTYNEHSATTFLRHYKCRNCGLVSVGNDISDQELAIAYSTLDSELYFSMIKHTAMENKKSALADLKRVLKGESKIIDIGAGNGLFMKMLLEGGFSYVFGHEIPSASLSEIENCGFEIYHDFDFSSIPSASFDAVTLLDVAEHVKDPRHLISSCRRILRSKGLIYLHVPIVSRLDRIMHLIQKLPLISKISEVFQRSRTSVFHLQIYTPRSLNLLLNEFGFTEAQIILRNELSWPVREYIRVYLCEKYGLPKFIVSLLAPLLWPVLTSTFLNANKAIVIAKKTCFDEGN